MSEAILLVKTIMFDIMPPPISRLIALVIFVGIVFGIRKIVHLGGGD